MGKRYERIYMEGYNQAEADIKFDHKYLEWREAENARLKELNKQMLAALKVAKYSMKINNRAYNVVDKAIKAAEDGELWKRE